MKILFCLFVCFESINTFQIQESFSNDFEDEEDFRINNSKTFWQAFQAQVQMPSKLNAVGAYNCIWSVLLVNMIARKPAMLMQLPCKDFFFQ